MSRIRETQLLAKALVSFRLFLQGGVYRSLNLWDIIKREVSPDLLIEFVFSIRSSKVEKDREGKKSLEAIVRQSLSLHQDLSLFLGKLNLRRFLTLKDICFLVLVEAFRFLQSKQKTSSNLADLAFFKAKWQPCSTIKQKNIISRNWKWICSTKVFNSNMF